MSYAILLVPLLFLFTGLPVGIALGLGAIIAGYLHLGSTALIMAPQAMFSSVNSFLFVAIPVFVLMSEILSRGGIGEILYETANTWLRHLPGGLAVSTVATAAALGSVTGSSIADMASLAIVAIPAMLARGYERKFVYGLVCTSGTLAILIPPSIPMILYGAITSESVGKLFIAGMIPGILLALTLSAYAMVACSRASVYTRLPRASWSERIAQTRKAAWGLLLPPIVIGGMYTGLFTPTEAAAVGTAYALFLCTVIYKTGLTVRAMGEMLISTMMTTSMVVLVTAGALVYGNLITVMQVPQDIVRLVVGWELSTGQFMLCVMLLLFLLGCVMEVISIILITIPILFPTIVALGIDPIWFGVIFTVNMMIAQITPPVGILLFVMASISKQPIEEVIRGVSPFIVILVLYLGLLIMFPGISLSLTRYVK